MQKEIKYSKRSKPSQMISIQIPELNRDEAEELISHPPKGKGVVKFYHIPENDCDCYPDDCRFVGYRIAAGSGKMIVYCLAPVEKVLPFQGYRED